jgi:hypothetical protein
LANSSNGKDCRLSVNVHQLLKSKNKYDQKMVCAIGLLRVEFEGSQLSLEESKVWLQFFEGPEYTDDSIDRDTKRMKEWERLYQNECVIVRGRFDTKNTGHFGMWPAGIDKIESITKTSQSVCNPNTSLHPPRTR